MEGYSTAAIVERLDINVDLFVRRSDYFTPLLPSLAVTAVCIVPRSQLREERALDHLSLVVYQGIGIYPTAVCAQRRSQAEPLVTSTTASAKLSNATLPVHSLTTHQLSRCQRVFQTVFCASSSFDEGAPLTLAAAHDMILC